MSPCRNLGFSGISEEIHALMNKLSSEGDPQFSMLF